MLCKISFLIYLAFYLHYKATIIENTRKDAIFSLKKTKPAVKKKISFLKNVICLKPIPKIIAQIFCLNNYLLQEEQVRYDLHDLVLLCDCHFWKCHFNSETIVNHDSP